ncbi:MAG TPA: 16S rRNA (guanine(527)-N(7))-methyltransferase RsmG [Gammaproteobacteria bacterium]|nr:16S rRNA (guanine(527)-N(7))-methyltransferase RsmG [Gammaproteobacteria bacterium]
MSNLERLLDRGVGALGIELDAAQRHKLCDFVRLIDKWNRAYNLSAIRVPEEMVNRHLVDSLSALPFVCGGRLLDVGTGAGLPGIPLAIARPAMDVVLLDANGKKTRFCLQAAGELELDNVGVVHSRAEDYEPDERFDTVISRAFGSLADFAATAGHLLRAGGRLVAMKGNVTDEERAALPASWRVIENVPLTVPGAKIGRRVLVLEPT